MSYHYVSTLVQAAAEVQQHQVFENRIQKMQEEETTFFFSIGHYSHHNKGITTSSREAWHSAPILDVLYVLE